MNSVSKSAPAIRERVRRGVLPLLAFALSLSVQAPVAAQDIFAVDSAPKTSVRTRTDWTYRDIQEFPGGKLIVLGSFKFVDGTVVEGMVRLNADGSIDPTFNAPYAWPQITRFGATSDGRVIILANLPVLPSTLQRIMQRLMPDGAIDPTFATLDVAALSPQVVLGLSDGGAYLLSQGGPNSMRARRVLPDGQLDPTYSVTPLTGSFVNAGVVGPSGELALFRATGVGAASVVLLSPTGILQPVFTGLPTNFRANSGVFEPDGSLVLCGGSTNGAFSPSLVRVLPSGVVDNTFSGGFPFPYNLGTSIVRLTDGTFMASGPGTPGTPAVAHFSANGVYLGGVTSVTASGANSAAGLRSSAGGGAYAYGTFLALDGVAVPNIARLGADRLVDPNFMVDITGAGRMPALATYRDGFVVAGVFSEIGEQDIFNLTTLGPDDSFAGVLPYFAVGTSGALGTSDGGAVLLGAFPPPFTPGPGAVAALKLRNDGTFDPLFLPTVPQGTIGDAAEQSDGRLVFAGRTNGTVSGLPVLNLFRTSAEGVLDTTFNNLSPISTGGIGLTAVAVDSQGRIVVAGSFTIFQGMGRPGLARVDANGFVDPAFAPPVGLALAPRSIRFLPDGSFYVVGVRSDAPSGSLSQLHRFNDDGSLHASQLMFPGVGVENYVLHPDGSLFVSVSSGNGAGILHVLPTGEIDSMFECALDTGSTTSMLVDDLGRVLVTGSFSTVNGEPHEGILRLAPLQFGVSIDGPARYTLRMLDTLTLTANVEGSRTTPTFQWFHNGEPIAGATGPTLTLPHLVPKNEGAYTVEATGPAETVTSASVAITLIRGIPAK